MEIKEKILLNGYKICYTLWLKMLDGGEKKYISKNEYSTKESVDMNEWQQFRDNMRNKREMIEMFQAFATQGNKCATQKK